MKTIPLTQGKIALVDDGDYEWLNQWKWCVDGHGYAIRKDSSGQMIKMHRLIMGEPKGVQVDHIDGNGLNNQRGNLRPATCSQSLWNRGKYSGCSSPFKGVCWCKRKKRWRAQIAQSGVRLHLGYFDTEEEAARAYDKAARELHEGFAKLNFPEYS
jgi:AP2 domain/HNH endonuclease